MTKIYIKIFFMLIISATSLFAINHEAELIKACANHDIHTAKLLIRDYSQNYTVQTYNEALLAMMQNGTNDINIELLQTLIDSNANINYRKNQEEDMSLLHSACCDINVNLVKFLIENQADVNAVYANIYSDDESEGDVIEDNFPLDLIIQNVDLYKNKKEDALKIVKCFLLHGANYSEEYEEEELLIKARCDTI